MYSKNELENGPTIPQSHPLLRVKPTVRAWGWRGWRRDGRHYGSTCAGPASANQGVVDQRHKCFASSYCKKWGKALEQHCRLDFSVKRSELSTLCPLCVSGLGTAPHAEVIPGHPPPASGNTSNAMWLLHFFLFFSSWYWQYTTPAVLLLFGEGRV